MPSKAELDTHFHFPHIRTGVPLQVVRWSGQRVGLAFNDTTAALAIPTGAVLVEISATENCYIAFGGAAITASSTIATDGSRLFMAGVAIIPVPLDSGDVPYTHMAVIRQTTNGIAQVEEVT